jgi:predicted nucleic-acid-binding protein
VTGLDTNVLVRYLVEDDGEQGARAAAFIEGVAARDERLFVSDVVVCELVWVLESAYGFGRRSIGQTLHDLVRARQLKLLHRRRKLRPGSAAR